MPIHFTDCDVLLHLFSLSLHLSDTLFLLFQTRLQVMQDLLQLLLPGGQTGSHLLSLSTQLCFGLELLLKGQLLSTQLEEGREAKSDRDWMIAGAVSLVGPDFLPAVAWIHIL